MSLTDRERILLHIINGLQTTLVLAGHLNHERQFRSSDGHLYTHFAGYRDPDPGELVLCFTGNVDEWKVAWFVQWEAKEHGAALLREIGSDRLCRYGNEQFKPVVGLAPDQLLEGAKYEFLQKVHKAFRRGGEYGYRYGGLEFTADGMARVWVRKVFGSARFPVEMAWSARTSIAAILRTLRDGGYGTHKWSESLP